MFDSMKSNMLSPEGGAAVFKNIQRNTAALKLSEAAFRVTTGKPFDAQEYVDILQGKVNTVNSLQPLTTDLEELLTDVYQRPGLQWRLNCLNKSLGSLRAGDFGFIFARPETGKTTFLASEVSNFLRQTHQPIVWFNNEEQGQKVILRVYQAFFGVRLEQLIASRAKYHKEFVEAVQGRFCFYDNGSIKASEVERIIDERSPGMVVYDQIDKIKGFNADREDLRLGNIYTWARELAKNRHAAIGVCQADGSGENTKWLNMDNVSNAKTAKQAEADWILGIGKIHDPGSEYIRYLNICKNKLFGDEESNPELKHGRFDVLIEPHIARYKDIIDYS